MKKSFLLKYITFVYSKLHFMMVFWYYFFILLSFFQKKAKLRKYDSINQLCDVFSETLYVKNRFFLLNHPKRAQFLLNNKNTVVDCDNSSVYLGSCLLDSKLAKKVWFCVFHMERDDVFLGHSVCVYQDYNGTYHYIDYNTPQRLRTRKSWTSRSSRSFKASYISGLMFELRLFNNKFPIFKNIEKIP